MRSVESGEKSHQFNNLKIVSQNARALADLQKRTKVFAHFKRDKYDIILLQETHSSPEKESFWSNQWGGTSIFSHREAKAKGVCILFKKRLGVKIQKQTIDTEGHYIIVDIYEYHIGEHLCTKSR